MTQAVLDKALLDDLVKAIVEAVHPEKIVLFGSWARGDARPESDFDLFLQVESGGDTRAAVKAAYRAVAAMPGRLHRGIDIVVHDRAFVERYGDIIGTIVRPVLREGKVLYER